MKALADAKIRVSLFIEAHPGQFAVAKAMGAQVVELHVGAYCDAYLDGDIQKVDRELKRIQEGAAQASAMGLEVHAGHGLTFDTVSPVAAIPEIVELNIGHFLVGEAIFTGLDPAIRRMRALMDQARAEATGARSA